MKRRQFIKSAVAGSAMVLVHRASPGMTMCLARSTDSRIEVLINEPIGRINPEIYGHFAEHLGGVVYGGIWVGEDSKIPNVGGIRKSLVDALPRVKPSVVRWPGGCFADSYNWRDGIGPRSQRPRRTNFWVDAPEWRNAPTGPWTFENNEFGNNGVMR